MRNNNNLLNKIKIFLGLEEVISPPKKENKQKKGQQTIKLSYFKRNNSEIRIISPRKYSDAVHVANLIKDDIPVIINFQHLDRLNTKRFMDFVTGTVYSLNGHVHQLADHLLLITSEKMVINEDIMKPRKQYRNNANEEIVVNLLNTN